MANCLTHCGTNCLCTVANDRCGVYDLWSLPVPTVCGVVFNRSQSRIQVVGSFRLQLINRMLNRLWCTADDLFVVSGTFASFDSSTLRLFTHNKSALTLLLPEYYASIVNGLLKSLLNPNDMFALGVLCALYTGRKRYKRRGQCF